MSRRYHGRNKRQKQIFLKMKILGIFLILFALLSAAAYYVIDRKQIFDDGEFGESNFRVVEINGVRCRPKTRMKTYLFMGIDASGPVETVETYQGTGQCDVLELIVIDQNANTYARLPINRDTITEVDSLKTDGTYIGTSKLQISLAHANGDGREISCENTVKAVSHLLYDQPIDGYVALNMDSVSIINHMAGGVTVTVEDDFSQADDSLVMGETVTLTDEQALHFVRSRMDVGDGTNEGRMRRQHEFLQNLEPIMREKASQDDGFVLELYNALQDYMVTTLSGKDCSKLAKAMLSNESLGELQIEGESSLDSYGYNQFIADDDSLADAVIELFYERV